MMNKMKWCTLQLMKILKQVGRNSGGCHHRLATSLVEAIDAQSSYELLGYGINKKY